MILRAFYILFFLFCHQKAHSGVSVSGSSVATLMACGEYNLSNKFPWPSRDQDSMDWCFGHTAADLMSAKIGRQVSAADVSMNYFYGKDDDLSKRARNERLEFLRTFASPENNVSLTLGRQFGPLNKIDKLGYGYTNEAIDATQYRGVCLEEDFPSEDYRYSKHITNLKSLLSRLESERASEIPEVQLSTANEVTSVVPGTTPQMVMRSLNDKDLDPFSSLGDKLCKKRFPIRFANLKDHFFGTDLTAKEFRETRDAKVKLVNKNLSKQRPFSITYKSDILYDPKNKPTEGWHISTILGQRFNPKTNQCELLLRNTWGNDCSYAHESYACNKNNGHIWLPRDTLLKNTTGIHEAY